MTTLQNAFFALSLCLLGLQWASWRRFGEGEAKCKRLEGRVERLEACRESQAKQIAAIQLPYASGSCPITEDIRPLRKPYRPTVDELYPNLARQPGTRPLIDRPIPMSGAPDEDQD